jgi:hypothetical protein
MPSIINISFELDYEQIIVILPELKDYFLMKGMVEGIDYELYSGPVGDPLPRRSASPSDEPSPKQMKLFKWKLGTLYGLLHEARQVPDYDPVDINFARDVLLIAQTELDEHLSGASPISKKRIHDLIDAVLDAHKELEFSLAEA